MKLLDNLLPTYFDFTHRPPTLQPLILKENMSVIGSMNALLTSDGEIDLQDWQNELHFLHDFVEEVVENAKGKRTYNDNVFLS